MAAITAPALPTWGHLLSHWLLTRLLGSILFFIVLGCASSAYDAAYPEPPKENPDLFDGGGTGLAAGVYAVWGMGFEFCCALPLLLLLPGRLRRALLAPEAATRRRQFFGAIVGWQLLLPLLASLLAAGHDHDLPVALGLVGLGIVYALAAAGVAWLLYARWLADAYQPAHP